MASRFSLLLSTSIRSTQSFSPILQQSLANPFGFVRWAHNDRKAGKTIGGQKQIADKAVKVQGKGKEQPKTISKTAAKAPVAQVVAAKAPAAKASAAKAPVAKASAAQVIASKTPVAKAPAPKPVADKEKERERAQREKERERAQKEKEKEKAQREKEKEKAQKEKEKEKEKAQKEKEKAHKEKEKEKSLREKEKEKEKALKEKEKEKALKEKEKEKALKEKEKAKGKRDPNAPKRPLSPFLIFANEKAAVLRQENPNTKFGDVTKRVADLWNSASEAEKQKYFQIAAPSIEAYKIAREKYESDRKANKKPATGYALFVQQQMQPIRSNNPGVPVVEIMKQVAQKWKTLSDSQKQAFLKK